ncbi:MAG: hypothetical protein WDN23_12260 [Edaphobacter sp.]
MNIGLLFGLLYLKRASDSRWGRLALRFLKAEAQNKAMRRGPELTLWKTDPAHSESVPILLAECYAQHDSRHCVAHYLWITAFMLLEESVLPGCRHTTSPESTAHRRRRKIFRESAIGGASQRFGRLLRC